MPSEEDERDREFQVLKTYFYTEEDRLEFGPDSELEFRGFQALDFVGRVGGGIG